MAPKNSKQKKSASKASRRSTRNIAAPANGSQGSQAISEGSSEADSGPVINDSGSQGQSTGPSVGDRFIPSLDVSGAHGHSAASSVGNLSVPSADPSGSPGHLADHSSGTNPVPSVIVVPTQGQAGSPSVGTLPVPPVNATDSQEQAAAQQPNSGPPAYPSVPAAFRTYQAAATAPQQKKKETIEDIRRNMAFLAQDDVPFQFDQDYAARNYDSGEMSKLNSLLRPDGPLAQAFKNMNRVGPQPGLGELFKDKFLSERNASSGYAKRFGETPPAYAYQKPDVNNNSGLAESGFPVKQQQLDKEVCTIPSHFPAFV